MLIRVHLPHKMVVLFITNYRTFQDGHEICFVGDEAFRELSQVDSNADKLLDEVCYHCHYSRYRIGIYFKSCISVYRAVALSVFCMYLRSNFQTTTSSARNLILCTHRSKIFNPCRRQSYAFDIVTVGNGDNIYLVGVRKKGIYFWINKN